MLKSSVSYQEKDVESFIEYPSSKKCIGYTCMQDASWNKQGTLFSEDKDKINKKWLSLDSQSTVDLFFNASLLTNIRTKHFHLDIFCNAGNTKTNVIGKLEEYGDVWLYSNGILNILYIHCVAEHFHITCDSYVGNCFTVWKQNFCPRKLIPGPCKLYFCNLQDMDGHILATTDTGTSKFRTVLSTVTID